MSIKNSTPRNIKNQPSKNKMTHVDVNWCASETTVPFDPIVTDGILSGACLWSPADQTSSPSMCQRITRLILNSGSRRNIQNARLNDDGNTGSTIGSNHSQYKTNPTIHLGEPRHITRIEIFWGAYPIDHASRTRTSLSDTRPKSLFPPTGKPKQNVMYPDAFCPS